ncbi:integrase catalytic domain-containing protein [Trichonephila clavipes]|nr:integrase catalytic domain-containing protein [Trichonephila clavipes]
MKRLDQLWRRLSKDKQMENLYREFMQQYLDLGYMEKEEDHSDETSANNICYYLPHHGVFRPDKTTTKLRVVLNDSASTTSGLSLNYLFLKAIRTLKELAMDEASRFPLASKVALQNVYMDDVVSGAQNLDTARQLQCQLQNMLEICGMKLHQRNSNSKELLNSSSDQEHSFSTNAESAVKTLGVSWKPTGDYFMFKVSIHSIASVTTYASFP